MSGNEDECNGMGEGDSYQLLDIFPVEIWEVILDHLETTEDLEIVSNASPFFHRQLQSRRVEFLFPHIWDILGFAFHKRYYQDFMRKQNHRPARRSRKRRPRQWYSDILPLRRVCKNWRNAVDQWYYKRSLPTTDTEFHREFAKSYEPPVFDWVQSTFWNRPIANARSISSFLAHFEQTHGKNPTEHSQFMSDKVTFLIPRQRTETEEYQSFAENIFQLLHKYGEHVRICKFSFWDDHITPETFADLLEWLSLLLNLTSLKITFGICIGSGGQYQLLPEAILPEMTSLAASKPLQKLEKLEYLSVNNLAPCVASPLIRANSHVTVLRFKGGPPDIGYDIYQDPFPNLKELLLTYHSMKELEKLESSQFANSLEKLDVMFDTEHPPLLKMFTMWGSKWANTLTHLQFQILSPTARPLRKEMFSECEKFQKQFLPRVKQLQVHVSY